MKQTGVSMVREEEKVAVGSKVRNSRQRNSMDKAFQQG